MLEYRIGMIGNPVEPFIPWSDEIVEELKQLGFNAIQLNVAWGCRPGNEPLNIEDVVELPEMDNKRRKEVRELRQRIRDRLAQCKKHHMRSIFHFGAPFNGRSAYEGTPLAQCVSDPSVIEKYVLLLKELERQIPGIDDILLYTYDQDAWLCSEFVHCDACRGIPLHQRLPVFLNALWAAWREIRPNGRLWWEPWELSTGQTMRIVQELPADNFGLMLHSNTGEVQKARPVDLWFRDMAMLSKERGIPVVGECFLAEASEETEPFKRIPCPQLTYLQIHAVAAIDGVQGIKEYYGLIPGRQDPCLNMAGQVFQDEERSLEECLQNLAIPYGEFAPQVKKLWKLVSEGYSLFPWEVSWYAREIGTASPDHGWSAAFIRGQQASTPSWESSRHAVFMKTDNSQPHPWMLEDIQLRCQMAAERLQKAADRCGELLPRLTKKHEAQFRETMENLNNFARICRSYAIHLRMTNVAGLLREDCLAGRQLSERLLSELGELLQRDVENQDGCGRVVERQREFEKDPKAWLKRWLLVSDENRLERGDFSLTTR